MGGLGWEINGGYAEYTCVPVTQAQVIKTEFPWDILGATPEMLQTAHGSLFRSLRLAKGDSFLLCRGTTLLDSSRCVKTGGITCMTRASHGPDSFAPFNAFLTAVNLTTYQGESPEFMATPLEEMAQQIKAGNMRVIVGKTYRLDEIVEAHRMMDRNKASEKIVVLP